MNKQYIKWVLGEGMDTAIALEKLDIYEKHSALYGYWCDNVK